MMWTVRKGWETDRIFFTFCRKNHTCEIFTNRWNSLKIPILLLLLHQQILLIMNLLEGLTAPTFTSVVPHMRCTQLSVKNPIICYSFKLCDKISMCSKNDDDPTAGFYCCWQNSHLICMLKWFIFWTGWCSS